MAAVAHEYWGVGQADGACTKVRVMPDLKSIAIARSLQLVREIAAQCQSAQPQCAELMFCLDTIDRAEKLSTQSFDVPLDLSRCKTIYDAIVAYLKANPERELTEGEVFEALIAGRAPSYSGAGFQGKFRKAVSNKERDEFEVIEAGTGNRDDNVLKLRPRDTAKHPPKSVK